MKGITIETRERKDIGLFGLVGMVIGSCIGTGAFAITGQLAQVASTGAILISWVIVGVGFSALAFSLNNLASRKPELNGIFTYAQEGFGPFAGFLSGWGYWLAAWLGNVAFATMLMSTIGYFIPIFIEGNTIPCVIFASVILWLLVVLVMRGVEQAAFLNAIIMVCKVLPLVIAIIFSIFLFNAGVFTADFWGTLSSNLAGVGAAGAGNADLGAAGVGVTDAGAVNVGAAGVEEAGITTNAAGILIFEDIGSQVASCMIIMMWCFLGIEGASVISGRAKHETDAGKATIIGVLCLLVLYLGASVLPYGYMPYAEIASLDYPALLYVFNSMAPGWGGPFIAIGIIVSILGAWLSFTILPTETTSRMAETRLLPASWGKLNAHNAPQHSLLIMSICTQAMLIVTLFSSDAYNFATSMCTVSVVIAWSFAAAYQIKLSHHEKRRSQLILGILALVFQIVGVLFNGWSFLLIACIGYIPGFVVYARARKEDGFRVSHAEKAGIVIVSGLGVLAIVLVAAGLIAI